MNKLLLVIIAILLPPLAVGLKDGIGFHLFLNIVLMVGIVTYDDILDVLVLGKPSSWADCRRPLRS